MSFKFGGKACIAWHSIANCAYLLENDGRDFLTRLLRLVEVAPVSSREAKLALDLPMGDLEDALQAVSAQKWGAGKIVTRNLADYKSSPVPAISPTEFGHWLTQRGSGPL